MTKDQLNQIATVGDIEKFHLKTIDEVKKMLNNKINPGKEFFTPKEFSFATGMKYSTVIYHCKLGKIKARQNDPKCAWQIFATEVDRFKNEASENIA